ncbi:hypothetical protein ANO11243_051320 [Dothideomycetidae sp. 11243]|nr:hypothetical protein ANO11243_051320 [fungal sp. No.11243]
MTSVFAGGLGNIPQTHGRHTVSSFQLALTTVTFMIGLALGHIFQTPSAVKVGKRLVYLYSAFLFIASALLCAFTKSLAAILVGRALMGIALSPMEVLIPATLAELFPLHKRGKVLGLYLSFFLGSINLVPSLSALIVSHIYWRWLFLITAVAAAVPFLLIFFFVPESYWNRSSRFLHSKECVESWTKPDSDQTIVCKCLGVSTVRGRGRAAMYDGHSAPVANPRIVAQRERVLGKLHIRSQNQDDNHLKVSDALKSPAVVSATFQNVELSPAEAEIALARDAFDEPGQVPLRRHPPTSLPVTPTPTANRFAHGNSSDGKAQETMAKNSSNNKNPGETFSLYTERLRVQGRQSWASSLKIWHGRLVSDRWSRIFLRPFRLIAECPTLLWAALLYAINVGLLAVLPRIVFLLFSGPWSVDHTTDEETQPWSGGRPSHSPRIDWNYQLDPLQVGGLSLATLLGVLVGALFAGWISDLVAVRMARRNDGVFEPEFRLLLVLPASCLAIAGALGFGFTLDKGAHVYLAGLCLLLIGAGCAAGTLVAVGYVVDCLTAEVAEAMVVLGLFKTLCHGIVFAILIDRWVCARGPKEVFIVIAGLHGLALLLTVPAYVFGKRARARGVRRNT